MSRPGASAPPATGPGVPLPSAGAPPSATDPTDRATATPRPLGPVTSARPRPAGTGSLLVALLSAALLVLPTAAAVLITLTQPTRFAAQVELLHEPEDTSPVERIDRELATHRVLLQQRLLLEEVAGAVGRHPRDLTRDLDVSVVDDSSVLQLGVVDVDPRRARETLTVLVDRYLLSAGQLARDAGIGQLRVLAPPSVLDEPVGPDPLRAGAAGLLLGMSLVVVLLALRRQRHGRSRAA